MKVNKIRALIEIFENALCNELQYEDTVKFNGGLIERRDTIRYYDVSFEVRELSGLVMQTGEYINRIVIEVPMNIRYNKRSLYVQWRSGYSRTESVDLRRRACRQLAHELVTEVLPEVDYQVKKEVHNYEIDKILEILE